MDIEDFYDENPERRASEEFEYGWDWSDSQRTRCGLSWVNATGELYVMTEPSEPIITDQFGDQRLQAMPTKLLTVEVLGVVATRGRLEQILHGWGDAMLAPNSVSWVHDRLAHPPPVTDEPGAAAIDVAFDVSGDDDRSSEIILAAVKGLYRKLPVQARARLSAYAEQALVAGSEPTAEWHRAFACARWADRIVAIPAHQHLAAEAAKALEIVREIGITIGGEIRELEYLPFGRAVSRDFRPNSLGCTRPCTSLGKLPRRAAGTVCRGGNSSPT